MPYVLNLDVVNSFGVVPDGVSLDMKLRDINVSRIKGIRYFATVDDAYQYIHDVAVPALKRNLDKVTGIVNFEVDDEDPVD